MVAASTNVMLCVTSLVLFLIYEAPLLNGSKNESLICMIADLTLNMPPPLHLCSLYTSACANWYNYFDSAICVIGLTDFNFQKIFVFEDIS